MFGDGAAINGYKEFVEMLIEKYGSDPNKPDDVYLLLLLLLLLLL
jgi:hypothetical protein